MSNYDLSIHHNPDARAWAQFFMKCYAEYKEPLDEAVMIGWFANAMMAMYDVERKKFDAALATARKEARERCAKVAEGPPLQKNTKTGEVSLRGKLDGGNWSVPQPLAGYRGSDYGTGRYDAAAAIRAMDYDNG